MFVQTIVEGILCQIPAHMVRDLVDFRSGQVRGVWAAEGGPGGHRVVPDYGIALKKIPPTLLEPPSILWLKGFVCLNDPKSCVVRGHYAP